MKIALIAMSGVRVVNQELIAAGLNLPGFVERSEVIASLPSLGLLTLAALTPRDIEVDYHEVADLEKADTLPTDYDLVAISTFTAQARDSYTIADRYRVLGVPVVMGGLHVTSLPDEALRHADAVAVGEGEVVWRRILEDARSGCLERVYAPAPGEQFDLRDAPVPRFDLLDVERYNRITVQTSRGCPHRCNFCASSILLTDKYKTKPVERVLAEIHAIQELWPRPMIEFADDNSFIQRGRAKELCTALIPEHIHWFTETDISIAEDLELLDLMAASGCRQILVGLESPQPVGLDGLELRRNWKAERFQRYEEAIRAIQSRGITVNGCFILGLDGHTEDVFDDVFEFVDRTGLYEVQVTVLTPFPGTPLYDTLRKENRLIREEAWELCTLFDVNHHPRGMSAERLQRGIIDLSQRLYDPEFVKERRQRFFRQLRDRRTRERARARLSA